MALNRLKTFGDTISSLGKGEISPYYCISGAEEYLRRTAIESIEKNLKTRNAGEVAVNKVFGDEAEPDRLEISLLSFSLFAEKSLLIIKDARKMKAGCWDVIERFVDEPSDICTLVLEDDKFDKRKKSIKAISKSGNFFEFPELYETELLTWIKSYARKNGYTITDEAAQYLRDSIEPKLTHYIVEFEKLRLFLGEGAAIGLEDLQTVTKSTRSFNIFEFIDAIFSGNKNKSFEYLNDIFTYNESVPGVIVMIVRQLNILLKIKLNERGSKAAPQKLGLSPFHYRLFLRQANSMKYRDIETGLEACLEADTHLKTGYRNDRMVMTILITKLLNTITAKQ